MSCQKHRTDCIQKMTNKQTKKCVYDRSSHKAPGGGKSGWVVMLCS